MDQGVGRIVKRLREEKDWSMAKLAVEADMSVSGISMIENGKRNLTTTTLAKIAGALEVEVSDLFPKAEPLPFSDEAEQRLAAVPDVLRDYILGRVDKYEGELEDLDSPHFRTATAASLWLAGVNEEAHMWTDWIMEHMHVLQPPTDGLFDPETWAYPFHILGIGLAFHALEDAAKDRIASMEGKPDELARRRLEKSAKEAEESRQRAENFRRTASG